MTPGPGFTLITSGAVIQHVRLVRQLAAAAGLEGEYLRLLRTMVDALEARPMDWGDPQHDLLDLGLTVYHRMVNRFTVTYALDPARRFVYLLSILVLDPPG